MLPTFCQGIMKVLGWLGFSGQVKDKVKLALLSLKVLGPLLWSFLNVFTLESIGWISILLFLCQASALTMFLVLFKWFENINLIERKSVNSIDLKLNIKLITITRLFLWYYLDGVCTLCLDIIVCVCILINLLNKLHLRLQQTLN